MSHWFFSIGTRSPMGCPKNVQHCICVSKLTIIGSDNGLSPARRQAIIWTNARILLIGPLGTNFSEILIGIQTFSFTKMHLKMSSAKWRPFCLGLNMLSVTISWSIHCHMDTPYPDRESNHSAPGGRLIKKDGLTRYGNSHVKDKTS